MKEKTSITLSKEVLRSIDRMVGSKRSRSSFIEEVLLKHVENSTREQRDARDLELINRHAAELNRDALDCLEDQAPLGDFPEQ